MSNVDVEMRVSVIVDINVELNCEKLFRQVVIFAWNKEKCKKLFLLSKIGATVSWLCRQHSF